MSQYFYYIDGNVSAGQTTLTAIQNESANFGIGATTNINVGIVSATSLNVGEISTIQSLVVSGIATVGLGSTSSPSNSQLTFELTSDTNLRIKVRGSDGVLRSANITLA